MEQRDHEAAEGLSGALPSFPLTFMDVVSEDGTTKRIGMEGAELLALSLKC